MDGPVVADFVGKIALAEGTRLLRDTIHDFLRPGNNRIILNLADVDCIVLLYPLTLALSVPHRRLLE
jgi:hypothetical protein